VIELLQLDAASVTLTGNGPVDFKMSSGFNGRVPVEIKLSTNPKGVGVTPSARAIGGLFTVERLDFWALASRACLRLR
jgi:hypothetical protein